MRKQVFATLSKMNKKVLPKLWDKVDLSELSNAQKMMIGWKRWVTFNYLDEKSKAK